MAWFDDLKTPRLQKKEAQDKPPSRVPEGLWVKCQDCGEILQSKALKENISVCMSCGMHHRMTVWERIRLLSDSEKSFKEYGERLASKDPLEFDDTLPYKQRLQKSIQQHELNDALVCGKTKLYGLPYHLAVFEFSFMGGSMGVVVGEKIAMTLERALKDKLPAVLVCASGGARMQEGTLSLMQMAKASSLVSQMKKKGIPLITLLTHPTTGGVAASFATQADVILAEPKALIGFAGPRVIEQSIRQKLPEGFQRSEFLLAHGFLDRIVERKNTANEIHQWMLRLGQRSCHFR